MKTYQLVIREYQIVLDEENYTYTRKYGKTVFQKKYTSQSQMLTEKYRFLKQNQKAFTDEIQYEITINGECVN